MRIFTKMVSVQQCGIRFDLDAKRVNVVSATNFRRFGSPVKLKTTRHIFLMQFVQAAPRVGVNRYCTPQFHKLVDTFDAFMPSASTNFRRSLTSHFFYIDFIGEHFSLSGQKCLIILPLNINRLTGQQCVTT